MHLFKKAVITLPVLTDSPTTVPAVPHERTFRIYSDVAIHVAVGESATRTHTPIGEHAPELIEVPNNQHVSILGVESGTIWLTEV